MFVGGARHSEPPDTERIALLSFLASTLLAGANAVAIRYSNRELAPFWGAAVRFGLAAALLWIWTMARGLALPRGRVLVQSLTYGALNFGVAFALIYYGLVHVKAGLGMTILALTPLTTLLLAVLQAQEVLQARSVVGAALGLVGIAMVSRAPLEQGVPLSSLLALVGSTLCFGQAGVIVRRIADVDPITVNAIGMSLGALMLVSLSQLSGEPIQLPESAPAQIAIGYLALIGSVGVFVLYTIVLRYWTASRAAYQSVLVPLITVGLSAWLDREAVGWGLVLGGAVVLSGVYVGALRRCGAG